MWADSLHFGHTFVDEEFSGDERNSLRLMKYFGCQMRLEIEKPLRSIHKPPSALEKQVLNLEPTHVKLVSRFELGVSGVHVQPLDSVSKQPSLLGKEIPDSGKIRLNMGRHPVAGWTVAIAQPQDLISKLPFVLEKATLD
ncbi:hypothetical protein MRX96_031348 [Rhipicephalus microplus]